MYLGTSSAQGKSWRDRDRGTFSPVAMSLSVDTYIKWLQPLLFVLISAGGQRRSAPIADNPLAKNCINVGNMSTTGSGIVFPDLM